MIKYKNKIPITLIIVVLVVLITFVAFIGLIPKHHPQCIKPPVYETNYTIEEHIARIKERIEYRVSENIAKHEIENIEVDIVYSLEDIPRFFVAEITFFEPRDVIYDKYFGFVSKTEGYTKYAHCVGYIDDDVYKGGIVRFSSDGFFSPGKSAYSLSEIKGKKYFAQIVINGLMSGVFIVESEGKKMKIFDERCLDSSNTSNKAIESHVCGQDDKEGKNCEEFGSFKYGEIDVEEFYDPKDIKTFYYDVIY